MVCLRLEVRRSQARSKLESPSGILRGYICCRRKPKALVAAEIRAARDKRGTRRKVSGETGRPRVRVVPLLVSGGDVKKRDAASFERKRKRQCKRSLEGWRGWGAKQIERKRIRRGNIPF